jgi:hypothetical protein
LIVGNWLTLAHYGFQTALGFFDYPKPLVASLSSSLTAKRSSGGEAYGDIIAL